ncbi:MAG: PD-(D/E)XK nuclease family protein [Sumerlaeia bacterium]
MNPSRLQLRFVIGRAGSGKTAYVLDRVRRLAAEDPDGPPLIVLVPEQATFLTEQALLQGGGGDPLGATIRARVFSFERLASFLFAQVPVSPLPRLNDAHRSALMASIVARLRRASDKDRGRLVFARGVEEPLMRMVSEMKEQRIAPHELEVIARRLREAGNGAVAAKLEQLAAVAEVYQEAIRDRFQDPEESLSQLRHLIRRGTVLQGARLFVDGFTHFTPVDLEVLRGLISRCTESEIALTMPPEVFAKIQQGGAPNVHSPFFPIEEIAQRLLAIAAEESVPVGEPVVLPESGQHTRFRDVSLGLVEAGFLAAGRRPEPPGRDPEPALRFRVARNPDDETRLAAEQLLEWREAGWNWRDMAIVARDLGDYAQSLEQRLKSLRIPYFLDRNEPLETHPLIQGPLAALEAVQNGWRSEDVMAFAKSGLPRGPGTDADQVARLEEFAEAYPRRREDWLQPDDWEQPGVRSPFEDALDHARWARAEDIETARRAIADPLKRLGIRLRNDSQERQIALPAYVGALIDLIREFYPDGQWEEESPHDQAVLREVGQLLNSLIEAAGDELFRWETALDLLRETLGKITLPRIPPVLNQVTVGSADRSRFPELRGVVVIGLAEGTFPQPGTNATLLSDRDRDEINRLSDSIQFRPSTKKAFQNEGHFAYRALTRAGERLTLVRPCNGADGEPIPASPYWADLMSLFRLGPEAEEHAAEDLSWGRAQRSREAAAVLCRDVFKTRERGIVPPPMEQLDFLDGLMGEDRREFETVLESASARNEARLDPALARAFLQGGLSTSVSALEAFAKCPFQYFMRSMIRPEVAPSANLSRADVGNLAHAGLKQLIDDLREQDRDFAALEEGEIEGAVRASYAKPVERMRGSGLFSTATGEAIATLIRRQVEDAVRFAAAADRQLNVRTLAAETGFGRADGLESVDLDVTLPDGEVVPVRLRGQIDRIDRAEGPDGQGWLFVIDYKLSQRQQNWAEASVGASLQLPVYLLVLARNRERLTAEGGGTPRLGGALYQPIVSREKDNRGYRGILAAGALGSLDFFGSDIKIVTPGSWQKANEKTPSQGDSLGDRQFEALLPKAAERIHSHVRRIAEGEIEVRPQFHKNATPCGYCAYNAACRLDYSMNERRNLPGLKRNQAIDTWLGPPQGGGEAAGA